MEEKKLELAKHQPNINQSTDQSSIEMIERRNLESWKDATDLTYYKSEYTQQRDTFTLAPLQSIESSGAS